MRENAKYEGEGGKCWVGGGSARRGRRKRKSDGEQEKEEVVNGDTKKYWRSIGRRKSGG
jgi:hypothetical protein